MIERPKRETRVSVALSTYAMASLLAIFVCFGLINARLGPELGGLAFTIAPRDVAVEVWPRASRVILVAVDRFEYRVSSSWASPLRFPRERRRALRSYLDGLRREGISLVEFELEIADGVALSEMISALGMMQSSGLGEVRWCSSDARPSSLHRCTQRATSR